MQLQAAAPISVGQPHCGELGWRAVETAIAVMGEPVRTFKIYKVLAELTVADIAAAISEAR